MKTVLMFTALFASVLFFACGNPDEKKQNDSVAPDTSHGVSASHDSLGTDPAALVYVCPCGGCPDVKEPKAGKCPKCDMDLVEQKK